MIEKTLPESRALPSVGVSGNVGRGAALVLGTLFLAICAHLSVPLLFTPVPISVQPFGVLVIALVFSPSLAFATLLAYLFEGACGLPVFAPQGPGGLLQLAGPTAGYLIAYPFAAALGAELWQRSGRRGFGSAVLAATAAEAVIFLSGALWLGIFTHASAGMVLGSAVLPFLPGDVLKIAAAAALAVGVVRARRAQSL